MYSPPGGYRNRPGVAVEMTAGLERVAPGADPEYPEAGGTVAGGTGLVSTAGDYFRFAQMLVNGGTLDGVRLLSPATVRWAMSNQIGAMRGQSHPGDGYGWGLFNPVRISDGGPPFPGSVGDLYWGGITGPRYFADPKERLVGIVFIQAPSVRASYHAELRAMVYGALVGDEG